MNNKVIIIGGDHHNGLGLARALGINGVEVHSVVIANVKNSFLAKSKYIKTCTVFTNEKDAFDYIRENCRIAKNKTVLIPYSDSAAKELDTRLDEFSDCFFIPSISGRQGKIVELMDKGLQYRFAEENGIKMPKTTIIDLKSTNIELYKFLQPCILKPVISAEGDKKDITVCYEERELFCAIEKFKKLGYKRVLLQDYLDIDYEIDVFGCVLRKAPFFCMVPTHTIRSWPSVGGTNSFSFIITDEKIINECKKVISALAEYGFYGLYDIEIFVVAGKIYLNEINLRNSGDVYMALAQGYYYPFAWYNDIIGVENTIGINPGNGDYCMTECADLRHVFFEKYSLSKWINDFHKCKDYALRFKGDMKPAWIRYLYYAKKIIKRD